MNLSSSILDTLDPHSVVNVRVASANSTGGSLPFGAGSGTGRANCRPRATSLSVNRQIRESMGERGRKPSANENPVFAVLTLEITSDLVKLRKPLTRIEGHEQLDRGQPLPDRPRDARADSLEPLAR